MPNEKEKSKEALVHTYAEDLAEEIKKEQGSAYRLALEEERRREEERKEFSPLSKQNLIFAFFSLLLIGLAGFLIFFIFSEEIKSPQTQVTPQIIPAKKFLISTPVSIPLGFPTKGKILNSVKENVSKDEEKVLSLDFTEEKSILETGGDETLIIPLDLRRLMFIMEIRAPELLLKSLSGQYMLGVYKKEPFLVLEIEAFNNAFRGMREWENSMLTNLSGILLIDPLEKTNDGELFKDVLIKNQDARILSKDDGTTVITYGFKGEKFIVIAKNEEILFEIASRLML